jgi:isoleucyl-tRNA synthetase
LNDADGASIAGTVASGETFALEIDGQTVVFGPEDLLIETDSAEGYACGEDGGYLTALDTSLTEELLLEGAARELVRTVQDARKSAGLEVSDRIVLGVSGSAGVEAALAVHRDYLMAETLAVEWATDQSDPLFSENRTLDDEEWQIEISRIQNG